jgi:hypothetical protein
MARDGVQWPAVSSYFLPLRQASECWRSHAGLWLIVFTAPIHRDAKEEE